MIRNGWYVCPMCGWRLVPITGDSILLGVELYCKKCKNKTTPTIVDGGLVEGNVERVDAAHIHGSKKITLSY